MKEDKQPTYTIQITIAIIGLIGALGTALFANWDKVFVPEPTSTPLPNPAPTDIVALPTIAPTIVDPPTIAPTDIPTIVNTPTEIPPICEKLDGKSISISQIGYNGRVYQGTIAPNGILLVNKGGGSYSFTTVITFEGDPIIDSLVGTCQGNKVVLSRTRPSDNFVQDIEGTLTEGISGGLTMSGTFVHNTSPDTYTWTGQTVNP